MLTFIGALLIFAGLFIYGTGLAIIVTDEEGGYLMMGIGAFALVTGGIML